MARLKSGRRTSLTYLEGEKWIHHISFPANAPIIVTPPGAYNFYRQQFGGLGIVLRPLENSGIIVTGGTSDQHSTIASYPIRTCQHL
jgi:hypothetical protein